MLWDAKVSDCRKDMMRAFNIWRSALQFDQSKKLRIKRLVWRCYNNKMAQAFEQWINYS